MSISNDLDEKDARNIGVVGPNAHIEGGISFYNQEVQDAFIKENLDDVRSNKFVAPAHSQDIVRRVLENRFLLLLGKDRMGKAALSRHIADMLLQANPDELSVKRIRQNFDLIEVLDDLISGEMQNHIVLGYDVNITEIQENVDVLIRIARQNSKFIIFTSELSSSIPPDLQEFSVEVQINYPYTPQNIEKLLEQYFQPENIELKKNIQNISKRLISPSVAIRLAESLLKETSFSAYNQWIERLNDLEDFSKEVNRWLSNLGKSERILFLTLALFNDLPEYNFWLVYEIVIDALTVRDHTLIELDYYAIEENREFIVSEPSIAFKHIKDRNMVLLQLLKLHRRSLIKILPFLCKKIYEYEDNKDKKDRQMRRAIAEAVGCIGTVEREAVEYKNTLYAWAKHESASVRAAVGHAHRQMIKLHRQKSEDDGDKALSWILDEMKRYLEENTEVEREDDNSAKTFGPRWTVAASLGIINNYVSEDRFKQDILPIFEKVYRDDEKNVRVRKAAVYSMRTMGLSRFKQIRPALSRKAKDYNILVQLEVAKTLARLNISNKSDVHQLLQEWVIGQDEARLWTAFYTFCLLDYREEELLSILQQKIRENSNLQTKITKTLNDLLTNSRSDKNTVTSLFNNIAESNDISTNKILMVDILAANIYKHQSVSTDIVNGWIDSDKVILNNLAEIITERRDEHRDAMQMERRHLLENELDNNDLLNDFSKRLPEDVRDNFWNEVNAKREAAMQLERDRLLNRELNNDKLLNDFSLKLSKNEQSVFWKEVKVKREERRKKRLLWIQVPAGVVGVILLIKWIKFLIVAAIALLGIFFFFFFLSVISD
ncbi:MAG: hypothetical protein D3906_00665 [Candidatus Electrothrix sp. AUS1_2]|nr:hypothetical protein [Candidatus Electrothrix sp. AUS1_2]